MQSLLGSGDRPALHIPMLFARFGTSAVRSSGASTPITKATHSKPERRCYFHMVRAHLKLYERPSSTFPAVHHGWDSRVGCGKNERTRKSIETYSNQFHHRARQETTAWHQINSAFVCTKFLPIDLRDVEHSIAAKERERYNF